MNLLENSLLLSLLVIVLCCGLLYLYVSSKLTEQNHKISSMLGLITTMAQELQQLRNNHSQSNKNNHLIITQPPLIEVSDDEDEDEDTDSVSISDSDSDVTIDEFNDDVLCDVIDDDLGHVIGDVIGDKLGHVIGDKLDDAIDDVIGDELCDVIGDKLDDKLDDVLGDVIGYKLDDVIDGGDIKILKIDLFSNNESEIVDSINKQEKDYKKMNVNELRNYVEEKGLISDASKLKKNELIKLLEQ
jgi:hypothetical protein